MQDFNFGHLIVLFSGIFFAVASYAVLLSAFLPLTGFTVLDILAQDTHYKYFALLIIPTTSYFVIANWLCIGTPDIR
ncbi:transmembrane protein [Moniliophthora roreri]|nr:transmembrane protein [Moniliophthora roreri]